MNYTCKFYSSFFKKLEWNLIVSLNIRQSIPQSSANGRSFSTFARGGQKKPVFGTLQIVKKKFCQGISLMIFCTSAHCSCSEKQDLDYQNIQKIKKNDPGNQPDINQKIFCQGIYIMRFSILVHCSSAPKISLLRIKFSKINKLGYWLHLNFKITYFWSTLYLLKIYFQGSFILKYQN